LSLKRIHRRHRGDADAGRGIDIHDCVDGLRSANSAKVDECDDYAGWSAAARHFHDVTGAACGGTTLFCESARLVGGYPSLYVDVAGDVRTIAPWAGAQCFYRTDCGNAYVRGAIQLLRCKYRIPGLPRKARRKRLASLPPSGFLLGSVRGDANHTCAGTMKNGTPIPGATASSICTRTPTCVAGCSAIRWGIRFF